MLLITQIFKEMAKVINVTEVRNSPVEMEMNLNASIQRIQNKSLKQGRVFPQSASNRNDLKPKELPRSTLDGLTLNDLNDTDNKDVAIDKIERFEEVTENIPRDSNSSRSSLALLDTQNVQSYLDSEKNVHEDKARTRKKIFHAIIQNHVTKYSWIDHIFYPMAIIFISILFCVPFCLLPAHDLVKHPEYWYELLFHGSHYAIPNTWFCTYMACSSSNLTYFFQLKPLIVLFLGAIATVILITVSSNYVWTKILSYQHPIPFNALFLLVALFISHCTITWYIIPRSWRKNREIKRRMIFVVGYIMSIIVHVFAYQILVVVIERIRGPYQPVIALVFPVTRELTVLLFTKLIKNYPNEDSRGVLIVVLYQVNVNHSISLCYIIGSVADDFTTWVLIGFDFTINIVQSFRLVWTRKKYPANFEKQADLLQELAIAELVEFHAPLVFIFITALAYFTPIGLLIGNISNDYWAYHAIEDIGRTLRKMATFFLADFSSTVASSTILWVFCKIKLWNAFAVLQKEFFMGFYMILGTIVFGVSENLLILPFFYLFSHYILQSLF